MARITRAAGHLTEEEVKRRMISDPRPLYRQRWLIIYNALVEPGKPRILARHCGVSKATVHALISSYNRQGRAAVETVGKGGRRSGYLNLEEEREFLAPFFGQAERGELATTEEIWRAFEARVGHEVDDSTLYRLLARHGPRKLMPLPPPPQADPPVPEPIKKTLRRTLRQQSRHEQPPMSDPT